MLIVPFRRSVRPDVENVRISGRAGDAGKKDGVYLINERMADGHVHAGVETI